MKDEAKPPKTGSVQEPAKGTYSNVDRLMELAADSKPEAPSDDKPPGAGEKAPANREDPPKDSSMWKILLQLKPLLPYLARLVPVLDIVVGPLQSAGLSHEVKQSIAQSAAKIQHIQRDLTDAVTAAIDEQAVRLTRIEEEISRLRDAAERQSRAQAELAQQLESASKPIRVSAISLGGLLIAVIVMTAILLAHAAH